MIAKRWRRRLYDTLWVHDFLMRIHRYERARLDALCTRMCEKNCNICFRHPLWSHTRMKHTHTWLLCCSKTALKLWMLHGQRPRMKCVGEKISVMMREREKKNVAARANDDHMHARAKKCSTKWVPMLIISTRVVKIALWACMSWATCATARNSVTQRQPLSHRRVMNCILGTSARALTN